MVSAQRKKDKEGKAQYREACHHTLGLTVTQSITSAGAVIQTGVLLMHLLLTGGFGHPRTKTHGKATPIAFCEHRGVGLSRGNPQVNMAYPYP